MPQRYLRSLFAVVALSSGFAACDSPKTAHASFVGWYVDNIDPAYYTVASDITCTYYLSVRWDGDAGLSDIEYARIYLPDQRRYWSFTLDEKHFDAVKKRLFGYFIYTEDHNAVPIGEMQAAVKVKDGEVSTLARTMTAPGSTSTLGYAYAYSDDGSPLDSTYVAAIKRPTVTAHAIDRQAQLISISFAVNDSRAFNGYVWFYDSSGTYIGLSGYFRNSTSGVLSSIVNGGTALNIDGSPNSALISATDITLQDGQVFDTIAQAVLVVTDGTQYAASGRYSAHDYRAYSARLTF